MKAFLKSILTEYASVAKTGLIITAILGAFAFGFYFNGLRWEKKMLDAENRAQAELLEAQAKAKEKYDQDVNALTLSLESVRAASDDRLRELEAYRKRNAGNKTCHEADALSLAVEGEKLLKEADRYLEALTR